MHSLASRSPARHVVFLAALASLVGLSTGCDEPEDDDPIDCAQYLDEDACLAAGCAGMAQTVSVVDPGTCEVQDAAPVCVAGGEDVGTRHAYHRELDGVTVFARTAECDAALEFEGGRAPGEGWTECSGAAGEPAGCACLCSGGACPAQVELEAMNACEVGSTCPDFDLNDTSGSQASLDAAACFFDALIAATPGHLRAFGDFGDPQISINLWIGASGQAQRHDTASDANCLDCCGTVRPTLDLCTPADAATLQACRDAYLSGSSDPCMEDFGLWFSECQRTAPMCE